MLGSIEKIRSLGNNLIHKGQARAMRAGQSHVSGIAQGSGENTKLWA